MNCTFNSSPQHDNIAYSNPSQQCRGKSGMWHCNKMAAPFVRWLQGPYGL